MGEQRNLFLAIGFALAILLAYQIFVVDPNAKRLAAERTAQQAEEIADTLGPGAPVNATASVVAASREEALAESERVPVSSTEISGSISLAGAMIDDVSLVNYTRELDPASGIVTVLNPAHSPDAFFAHVGWTTAADGPAADGMPGRTTVWRLVEGETLSETTPVTLEYDSPAGIHFEREIEVDEHFMFTITDRLTNRSGAPIELRPYAEVERRGKPEVPATGPVVEGFIGMFTNSLIMRRYNRMQRDQLLEDRSVGGWLGITDKYWFAAVIPHPEAAFDGGYSVEQRGDQPVFLARWVRDPVVIADGEPVETKTYVFAGAKRAELLRSYETTYGIHRFNWAIDWGNFFFLTKPFFFVLEYFFQLTGNFGLAILLLVVVLKIITFPLANMSFKSMARLKALQPKVQELKERFKADQQRQQKEMMALYQREKVNPLAGCLPLVIQIPVFYALYKTLFVVIEMRHAPFCCWVQDLSARDPTNIWNLFGLLPYDPSSIPVLNFLIGMPTGFLALGVLPLLYGLTMAAMQTLNPPAPDPMQQRIFQLMPWIFMFIMAPFAAGLLIYWIWNNILSFLQQYVIMRRQGVDTPIGTFLSKGYGKLKEKLANGSGPSSGSGSGSGGGASGGGAPGGG